MRIEILGSGCRKCKQLLTNVEEAAQELGVEVEIEKVTSVDKISQQGVMITPALAVNGEVVSLGAVLSKDQVKKILS